LQTFCNNLAVAPVVKAGIFIYPLSKKATEHIGTFIAGVFSVGDGPQVSGEESPRLANFITLAGVSLWCIISGLFFYCSIEI
jgi:hypothetical protein